MTNGQTTLFDIEHKNFKKLPNGKYKRFKAENNYRKSTDVCCADCKYIQFFTNYLGNKVFYKCELMGFSNSANSDIRKSYVCDRWEE